MLWRKACCAALIGTFVSAISYSDIIPPGGGPTHPQRAWIELYAEKLPKGMILIFVDEKGNLLEKSNGKEALIINRSGTVYGVYEKQLSMPFSFKTNKSKLYELRTMSDNEIPSNFGRPMPLRMNCNILSTGAGKFELDCHDHPAIHK